MTELDLNLGQSNPQAIFFCDHLWEVILTQLLPLLTLDCTFLGSVLPV